MALRVDIPSANFLAGLSAGICRTAALSHAKHSDTARSLWRHILTHITTEDFLTSVVKHDKFTVETKFKLPDPLHKTGDLKWDSLPLTVSYQNLLQITDVHTPLHLVPWQLRVDFASETHPFLLTITPEFETELTDIFDSSNWKFWMTSSGFCIAPKSIFSVLESLSCTFKAWSTLRDFHGAGFTDFAGKPANGGTGGTYDDMPELEKSQIILPKHMFDEDEDTDNLNRTYRPVYSSGASNAAAGNFNPNATSFTARSMTGGGTSGGSNGE